LNEKVAKQIKDFTPQRALSGNLPR